MKAVQTALVLAVILKCGAVLGQPDHNTHRKVRREKLESVTNSGRTFDEMGNRPHASADTVLWEGNGGTNGNDPI